jgi:hypothetical protein
MGIVDWIAFGVQWLHVLLGIIYFGNALAVALILIPSLNPLPIPIQRDVGFSYGERATRLFDVIVPLIIILGILRGTVFGPIDSFGEVLGTRYGVTWLVALVVTVGVFLWGRLEITPAVRAMNIVPLDENGAATPELVAATDRVTRLVVLELSGFLVIFSCMVLMRFGI